MNRTSITAVVTEGCSNCKDFLDFWKNNKFNINNIELNIINFASLEGQSLSSKYDFTRVPAIIMNETLLSSGPIKENELLAQIILLQNKK